MKDSYETLRARAQASHARSFERRIADQRRRDARLLPRTPRDLFLTLCAGALFAAAFVVLTAIAMAAFA